MESLKTKIDFAVILAVKHANPNGDPLNGNRPRVNYDGLGELSDVCLKRKIRNRLMETGCKVFVQSDDNRVDDYKCLRARAEGELGLESFRDEGVLRTKACKEWIDVRAFGQVFAYKGIGKTKKAKDTDAEDDKGDDKNSVSVGIRGPVSIHTAFSVSPVSIVSTQITKSVSGEGDGTKRASDTMGMKHRIDHGLYVFYGSINPQLAIRTGFSADDALVIKDALRTLFDNDASSARPEGSMEVHKLFWWKHSSRNGQYSSAKVHRSLQVTVKPGIVEPKSIEDYDITVQPLMDLVPEIIEGH